MAIPGKMGMANPSGEQAWEQFWKDLAMAETFDQRMQLLVKYMRDDPQARDDWTAILRGIHTRDFLPEADIPLYLSEFHERLYLALASWLDHVGAEYQLNIQRAKNAKMARPSTRVRYIGEEDYGEGRERIQGQSGPDLGGQPAPA